jgi:RimJ/RimL family protein N-acetyltransferase
VSAVPELVTARLRLRGWKQADLIPFATLNTDPWVMEHFESALSRAQSDALVARLQGHFDRHGFGMWAVEAPGRAPFVGFVGLAVPPFQAHFTPCVEVGWRLAAEFWGRGYATEAAEAALSFGFGTLALAEIVAYTVRGNLRSRRVMERLEMTRSEADDFDHPAYLDVERIRHHVLYRMSRAAWDTRGAS